MFPETSSGTSKGPTKIMLAGVYLLIDGVEDLAVIPCRAAEPAPESKTPTMEALAGNYILVEGPEDLTVQPCQKPKAAG